MDVVTLNTLLAVAASLAAGAAIGLERELNGHPAGLRTHTIVCLTATVLMLAAARQGDWPLSFVLGGRAVTDPTRMAHGVLTGVGFLCAGVIFREGFSVQGLTTAASLWMTSALGILFGVGLWPLGVGATVVTLLVLSMFRMVDRFLPRKARADIVIRSLRSADLESHDLMRALGGLGLSMTCLSHRLLAEGGLLEHRLKAYRRGGVPAEAIARTLLALPGVVEFEVLPHSD